MQEPEHMEITASLMAGYRFTDGSLLEVDDTGDYIITNADGEVLDDTMKNGGGGGMRAGAMGWEDYGEVMDDLAAFLQHDGERFSYMGDDEPDMDDLIFDERVARWAGEHYDELSILANYREDKRLADCTD
jgi:hypothetical protein